MKKRMFTRSLAILLSALMMLAVMPIMQVSADPTAIDTVSVSQTPPTGGYTPAEMTSWYDVNLGYTLSYDLYKWFYRFTGEGEPSLENDTDWTLLGEYEAFEPGATYACLFAVTLNDSSYVIDPAVTVTSMESSHVAVVYTSESELDFVVMYDPAIGFAADSYLLSVGDVDVTEKNAADIFGDGTASYDPDTSTLTLNGATIKAGFGPFSGELYGILTRYDLTIEVKGDNVIDMTALEMGMIGWTAGIYAEGRLSIVGDGNLTINAADAGTSSNGIYSFDDLDMNFGGNLTVNAGAATSISTGIYAVRDLILEAKPGATLNVSGRFQGIYVNGSLYAYDFAAKAATTYGGLASDVEWATFVSNFSTYSTMKLTAIEPEAYYLSVAGVPVTDTNKNNILGDGTAKYDPTTRTLTLTNANLTTAATFTSSNFSNRYAVIFANQPLTINLVGNNVIDPSEFAFGPCNSASGIFVDASRLSIGGDGNLTVKSGSPGVYQHGIFAYKNLDITMKGDLTITGAKDENFTGIYTDYGYAKLDMAGTWTIDIGDSNTSDWNAAIYADTGMAIRNSGKATLSAGDRTNSSAAALYVGDGDLGIYNTGTFTATVGDVKNGDVEVIYAEESLGIYNEGTFTVTGGDAEDDSYGLFAYDKYLWVTNDGTMSVTTGDAGDDSDAIECYSLAAFSGKGTLTVTSGDGTYSSAIYNSDTGVLAFQGSGTYNFSSGTATKWSATIYSGDIYVMEDVSLTVNAEKSSTANLNGIQSYYSIAIATSGDVNVTVGKAADFAIGINTNTLYLGGSGDVSATAGKGGSGSVAAYGKDAVTIDGSGNVSFIADSSSSYSLGIEVGAGQPISFSGTNLDNKIYIEGGQAALNEMPTFDPDFYAVKASTELPANLQSVGLNVTNFNTFKAIELTSLVKTVEDVAYGDANNDESIDMKDVLTIRKFISKLIGEKDLNLANADANADGDIDMKDVLLIRKFIANLITKLGPTT